MKITSLVSVLATALLTPGTHAAAVPTNGTISTTSAVSLSHGTPDTTKVNFTSDKKPSAIPRSLWGPRCNKKKGHYCAQDRLNELATVYDPYKNAQVPNPCKHVSVLWAHWDPEHEKARDNGWINFDNLGGLFADEMAFVTGFSNIALQGVKYVNDVNTRQEALGDNRPSIDQGAVDIEMVLNQTAHFCPRTKFVLAGEFWGARMIHVAVGRPGSVAASDRVKASEYLRRLLSIRNLFTNNFLVVTFNDPFKGVWPDDVSRKKAENLCRWTLSRFHTGE